MRRAVIIVVILLVVGGVGYAGYRWLNSQRASVSELQTAFVERGTIVATVDAAGSIAPATQSSLSFGVSGTVAELYVAAGDQVEAGQTLARLDTTDLERAVTKAQADLVVAQIRLEEAQHPYSQLDVEMAQGAVRDAQVALENAQTELYIVQNSSQVGENIRDLEYEVAWYETHYGESLRKYEQGRITKERLDLDFSNLMTAKERLETARAEAEMALATAQNNVARAEDSLRRAEEELATILAGPDPDDIALAQAQVTNAEIALERARDDLEVATLGAPFSGTIASLDIEMGDRVAAGTPIIRLIDASTFHLDLDIDEVDIAKILVGQQATITLDSLPDRELPGEVEYIAPTATSVEGIVTYEVQVKIGPTDIPLKAGMTANATIVIERIEGVLLLPNRAIQIDRESGRIYVEKIVGGEPVPVEIEVGLRDEFVSEVVRGLEEGDEVVVRGVARLQDVLREFHRGQ